MESITNYMVRMNEGAETPEEKKFIADFLNKFAGTGSVNCQTIIDYMMQHTDLETPHEIVRLVKDFMILQEFGQFDIDDDSEESDDDEDNDGYW
ncbi:hypothetical protein ACFOQM_09695 [Paenibacillus sp. GCM10012307]